MRALLLCALLLQAVPPDPLAPVAAALRGSPAWRANFVQRYVPAGFTDGTSERGTLLVAAPARLRFDYQDPAGRVFAVDGSVVRHVDPGAGTCDALRLDAGAWARLPLAALLDRGAAIGTFRVVATGATITLTPVQPSAELAAIDLTAGPGGLPATLVVRDESGNRNEFVFSAWKATKAPGATVFAPALPGQPPCAPEQP